MKIIKVVVGLILLFAVIRAGIEEGGNAKGIFPVILVMGLGGVLVYIIYLNYFKKKDSK